MWAVEIEGVKLTSPNRVRFVSREGMLANARRVATERAGAASGLAFAWQKKGGRVGAGQRKAGKKIVFFPLLKSVPFPVIVTCTRISPGSFDKHDNAVSCFKNFVDGIADALGIRDNDKRVTWRYAQEKSKPGRYVMRITLEHQAVAEDAAVLVPPEAHV